MPSFSWFCFNFICAHLASTQRLYETACGLILGTGCPVPANETHNLLAAGLSGAHLQLGRSAGVCRDHRRSRPGRARSLCGAFFWTLGYDTIYAHQDKEDDAMVGVKSTALKFGDKSKIWIGVFYTCTMFCFAVAGVMLHLNLVYFIALLFPTTLLFTQVRQVDLDNPQDCLYHFKSNAWIGVWLLGGHPHWPTILKKPMENKSDFIRTNTALEPPPLVPEIKLHLASEDYPLWYKTSDQLDDMGLPPPFWAFAWAGGQALARYIVDNPEIVRGKTVLDFGSGSGIAAIAAAKMGATKLPPATSTNTLSPP